MLLFTFGTAAVTGLVFGALLAVPRTGRDLRQGLAEAGLRLTGGRAIRRIQRGLVITEIGAAFTLAICAGLMVRTFTGLLAVDPGFNPQHVLAIGMGLPGARADQAHPFFEDLAQRPPPAGRAGRCRGLVAAHQRAAFRHLLCLLRQNDRRRGW